jgi:hypothetical protein
MNTSCESTIFVSILLNIFKHDSIKKPYYLKFKNQSIH